MPDSEASALTTTPLSNCCKIKTLVPELVKNTVSNPGEPPQNKFVVPPLTRVTQVVTVTLVALVGPTKPSAVARTAIVLVPLVAKECATVVPDGPVIDSSQAPS